MKRNSVWGIALKDGTIQATQVFDNRQEAEDAIAKISHLSNGFEVVELGPVNSPALPDGWVKCSERMPEKRGHYLVCTESGLVTKSSYSLEHTDYDDVRGCHKLARKDFGKYSRHFEYARASLSKITHWMTLPPQPTTEK